MKITRDHIGKFVNHDDGGSRGPYKVLDFGDDGYVWLMDRDGKKGAYHGTVTGWFIVEEPKKPSERLEEIIAKVSPHNDPDPDQVLKAVGIYLDEQAEKKQ